jgi:fatty-acyl-CoA synthase
MSDLAYEAARAEHALKELSTTMMSRPLRVTDVMRRAETLFADVEIVSRVAKNRIERTTYAAVASDARRLAGALRSLGVKPGQRVATLMWNHASHLTTYYAVPAIDAVLHPVNIRLSAEEIAYIIAQAGDEVVIVDHNLLPLYEEVEQFVRVPHVIVHRLDSGAPADERLDWHALLASASAIEAWPDGPFDENRAVSVCYTSGTSGRPKGVVYSHRSTLLHGFAASASDNFNISGRDTLLPLTPLFHVNGWSLPYSAAMFGAKLVFSGPHANGEDVLDLMASERVTAAFGVPTFWADALKALQANPTRWKLEAGTRIYAGGAAPSIDMIRRFDAMGVYLQTGWGMTECSPIGTQTWLKRTYDDRSEEERIAVRTSNGIALPFVELRHVDAAGDTLAWDGVSRGELQVRGPWVTRAYLGFPDLIQATTSDGWFQTGDVVTIGGDGYIRLVDRIKDLVKSGGEWISSADMEQKLLEISGVSEAAVIGVPDERWGERPLALISLRDGVDVDETGIRAHLASRYPKWMVPDKVVILDELPHTSVGKLDKLKLRKQFAK